MTKTTTVTDEAANAPKVVAIQHHRMGDRMPWQRMTLTAIGIVIIVVKWQWSVWHLYSLPEPSYSSFTTITINSDYVIGALVIFFVTGKLLYDWKNATTTQLAASTQDVMQRIEEHRKEEIDETLREFSGPELQERYGDR